MKCNEEPMIISLLITPKGFGFFMNLKTDISTSLFSWWS